VRFASYRSMLMLLGLTVLGSVAIGSLGHAAPSAAPQFLMKDFMFTPMSVTVKAGDTVTWANKDDEPHTVVSDNGLFRSAALDTDETFSFKFDKPGTYHFTCSIHPRMVGTIVVE
jgi:plastocyanin